MIELVIANAAIRKAEFWLEQGNAKNRRFPPKSFFGLYYSGQNSASRMATLAITSSIERSACRPLIPAKKKGGRGIKKKARDDAARVIIAIYDN